MTYAEKLLDPRWQKKRLEVLNRDNWTCCNCGCADTTLHVHHEKYSGNPWEAKMHQLTTLCKNCHFIEEYIKAYYPAYHKVIVNKGFNKVCAIIGVDIKDPSLNKILLFTCDSKFITELEPYESYWLSSLSEKTYSTQSNG